eukprot:CAMPEP_0202116538 /NCGR_PEP_ID=MMETSP0965-20130614/40826_1 /ASSEMBLY_ACC=CAM_ASM_000507 /TAXON_ID=4773 /ORGANISM="Schizochytrium aggregatum, Strain ATCC28209" /LENGTH=62 /DNA_ID=CAMNT_0048686405 /DNA_START=179 /DNA_END=367 /DNA_ORIENTATION=+
MYALRTTSGILPLVQHIGSGALEYEMSMCHGAFNLEMFKRHCAESTHGLDAHLTVCAGTCPS